MTTANKISILRILLVPVFVTVALYYGQSVTAGSPDESLRFVAIALFAVAAASDGLDGFIARRFNQRTQMGAVLDPIADKGLMISALIVLSVGGWPEKFPLWFPILVITRDIITLTGGLIVYQLVGDLKIAPHWTGKFATVLQITAIGWVMLRIPDPLYPTVAAGVFTFISGAIHVAAGISQYNHHEATHGPSK